jgi:hypothetical protein
MIEQFPEPEMDVPEEEFRRYVAEARLRPEARAGAARIFRAIRRITDRGSVFYVLADTPSQREDLFTILVDDKEVIGFELDRSDPDAPPVDIEQYSVEEYQKTVTGFAAANLRVALELARKDLGR